MFIFDYFGFFEIWSPFWIIFLIVTVVMYLCLVNGSFKRFFGSHERISVWKQASFLTGLILLFISGSWLEVLGHFIFSVHMLKMAILYLTVPPLLLAGLPDGFYLTFLKFRHLIKMVRFFTRPSRSIILFVVLFSFYHFPSVFDTVMTNEWLRWSYYWILFIAALIQWWPIMTPFGNQQSLSGLKKILYISVSSVALIPTCALIIFANHPFYATYTDPLVWASAMELCVPTSADSLLQIFGGGPGAMHTLTPMEDQRLGGILMKVAQEMIYMVLIVRVFFEWVESEKRVKST